MARVLITRYSQIGDVLILLPALNSLAELYPKDEFIVLSNPKFIGLFNQMPQNISLYPMIYRKKNIPMRGLVHLFNRYRLLIKLFFNKKFDKVIILQEGTFDTQLGNILKTRGSKIYQISYAHFMAEKRLYEDLNKSKETMFQLYTNIFKQLGYNGVKADFDLSSYKKTSLINNIFEKVGLNVTGKPIIGIAPFSRIKAKMYPLEKMEQILAYYNEKKNMQIVIFGGGDDEKNKAEEWMNQYPRILSLINKLSFDEEISVISACNVILSMDSANMHLAALVKTPVVSIWGPSDPRLGYYPINEKLENAIQKELNCRPCSFWGEKECSNPKIYTCMDISPQIILNKINSII